jgi:hypothetical protein
MALSSLLSRIYAPAGCAVNDTRSHVTRSPARASPGVNLSEARGDKMRIFVFAGALPMPLRVVFWLILGGWATAAVLGLIQLAFAALAADARGARLPARSVLPALRNPIRFGVICTSVIVFSATFQAINEAWDLGFKPLSYDLSAYSGTVKTVVLVAGVWACSAIVFKLVDRLLHQLLPDDPANRTPMTDNGNDRRLTNGNHA